MEKLVVGGGSVRRVLKGLGWVVLFFKLKGKFVLVHNPMKLTITVIDLIPDIARLNARFIERPICKIYSCNIKRISLLQLD